MMDDNRWRWIRLRQTADGRTVSKEWADGTDEPPSFMTETATVAFEVMRGLNPEKMHRVWPHVFGYRYGDGP